MLDLNSRITILKKQQITIKQIAGKHCDQCREPILIGGDCHSCGTPDTHSLAAGEELPF